MTWLVTRRQASALLGTAVATAPALARAAAFGPAADTGLLVVLGDRARLAQEIARFRAAGRDVASAADPLTAWHRLIAPELARGRHVTGVGDAGYVFCLSQLARDGRHRFERGTISFETAGCFDCGAAGEHLLTPALQDEVSAWRIHPASHGDFRT